MLVTILDRRTYFHSDVFRSAITLNNPYLHDPVHRPGSLVAISHVVARQATNAGYADAMYALVPVALTAVVLALLLRPARAGA
jgi:hypothetical protein